MLELNVEVYNNDLEKQFQSEFGDSIKNLNFMEGNFHKIKKWLSDSKFTYSVYIENSRKQSYEFLSNLFDLKYVKSNSDANSDDQLVKLYASNPDICDMNNFANGIYMESSKEAKLLMDGIERHVESFDADLAISFYYA